ncbi:MAG TPA: sugar transferase [Terracidiphilus sp.]|jgi:exopolysaccharide biosynthesis polyprenyl glycosylphosphotransferase
MILDGLTVIGVATAVTLFERHASPITGLKNFWHGTLIHGESMGLLLTMLLGFTAALIETSRRMHLYDPTRLGGFLHEQRLTFQACFISGLLLAGALYVLHASEIPRTIVMMTLGLVMISLSLRRLIYRSQMYQRFERGTGTRNVLIVGTGREAQALRQHFMHMRHLGYSFKGFIELPGNVSRARAASKDIVGGLDSLFEYARKHFVDEIFIAGPCESGIVPDICKNARIQGVDLRVIPDMYDGLAWNRQIEYIGQFPTISLHRGHVPELALVVKRILDVLISTAILILLSPLLLVLAIAIKLDSPGPLLYISERIGKKGRVFGCIKFRTMVRDAESIRANILSMNERRGILFKIKNDPRVTKLGRILRKYSLDEIPQFVNVLRGDMSIVGPRPPIASEVREYELKHLRRLDVTPGITGLWQVQGRQHPEFDSYIMLDLAYIENWNVWLDLKIIVRTIGVVFAGTGS